MGLASGCAAWLPALACAHGAGAIDMLLYLLPSAALALLLWIGSGAHPFFFVFTAAGTLCHELAHFSAGLLTNAEPVGLSVIPRRIKRAGKGHNWELGSVTFANLRWYNAAPAALAPLLVLGLPFAVAWWRTRQGWVFEPVDLLLAVLLAPQFLSFWPSPVDWRLAARSWPWIPLLLVAGLATKYGALLLALVKG
ncbi:hypothetical protein [Telluria aromaticivorans]|uniref:M50 family peptidase n=1 Tax=Telluria aromaticivorans TaxID=2725995 RepID=A0A7Y2JZ56_9BURK|nr:hypothetical protein [Telluria aromaticivorans]NNG23215.1 hypothetical protein [Telluria aromaticivorans]